MEKNIQDVIAFFVSNDVSLQQASTYIITPQSKWVETLRSATLATIVITLSGQANVFLDGVFFRMKPGLVLHIAPGACIDQDRQETNDCYFVALQYTLAITANQNKDSLYDCNYIYFYHQSPNIGDSIHQLLECQSKPELVEQFRVKRLFVNLLWELFDAASLHHHDYDGILMNQILEYIEQWYVQPITMAQLANVFHLDKRKIAYLFERRMGISPSNYITRTRMSKAKEMLGNCHCPIKQVAECVGYDDSLYFSRVFKKHTGMSPSEYRLSIGCVLPEAKHQLDDKKETL